MVVQTETVGSFPSAGAGFISRMGFLLRKTVSFLKNPPQSIDSFTKSRYNKWEKM